MMTTQGSAISRRNATLRAFVQECARQPAVVNAFNRIHRARLAAPIEALLRSPGDELASADSPEGVVLAQFLAFSSVLYLQMVQARRRGRWRGLAMELRALGRDTSGAETPGEVVT